MNWPQDDWPMPSATPPPSRLLGGVELHVMVHHREESEEATQSATLLVNSVDTPEAIKTLETVLGSVNHVKRSSRLFSGPNGVARLAAFLRRQQFSTLDAVLLTAGNEQIEAAVEQAVVDAIKKLADGLVVIVDDDCPRWAGLRAITGFVQSERATSAFAAASLARFLAALRTPLKFTDLDPDDIVHSFGSASEPAVLLEAIYLGSEGKVKFANRVDAKLARASTHVTAFITGSNMRFVRPAKTTLFAALNPDCAFTFHAPTSPALAPFLRGHVALLQLICRGDML